MQPVISKADSYIIYTVHEHDRSTIPDRVYLFTNVTRLRLGLKRNKNGQKINKISTHDSQTSDDDNCISKLEATKTIFKVLHHFEALKIRAEFDSCSAGGNILMYGELDSAAGRF